MTTKTEILSATLTLNKASEVLTSNQLVPRAATEKMVDAGVGIIARVVEQYGVLNMNDVVLRKLWAAMWDAGAGSVFPE